jgi:methionyl-tRNA formyltransferase
MTTLSDSGLRQWIRKNGVELLVVFSMSRLLNASVFEAATYGTINLHPSFLPDYRGPNPWLWMYLNMEEWGGVTVHFIDKGEDTGDILLQKRYEIHMGIKSPALQDLAIEEIGSRLLIQAIDEIETLPRVRQPVEATTGRARNINIAEHSDLVDWESWPIERIWHLLRGTELWLNAIQQPSGKFKGMRWSIQDYEIAKISAPPGSLGRFKGRRVVFCREGVINLRVNFNLSVFLKNLLGR